MAYFRENSKDVALTGKVYVVQGETIRIKVKGLGPGGKAIVVKAVPAGAVEIEHKTIGNPKYVQLEQNIVIAGETLGVITLHGYVDSGSSSPLPGCAAQKLTDCISPVTIEILPRIELPPINTEAGALARMLVLENIAPDDKERRFTNNDDALKSMQWMRLVLDNRLSFSHPQLLQVPKSGLMLDLLKSGGVIEGFREYPALNTDMQNRINNVVAAANSGTHPKFLLYRGFVQNALDVATGKKKGVDPCSTKLYAWRTQGTGAPSVNFEKYQDFNGQTFWTLKSEFIKDPLQRGKK